MNNKFTNEDRNIFIEQHKEFIYKVTYNVCKRTLYWENDDELSIAMLAFNKACDSYVPSKGDFFAYARILIKNALIDFFRKNSQNPYLIFDEDKAKMDYIDNKISLNNFSLEEENKIRAEEIVLLSKELKNYKLDFSILADSSPSHKDTRNSILNIAMSCCSQDEILSFIKTKKQLPVKNICILTGANKKTIDKWRRYLLSLIIILSSDDYPYIKSYLNIEVGEKND